MQTRRRAPVTGATQGTGLAVADRPAAAGCDPVVHGIEPPDVAAGITGAALPVDCGRTAP